MNMARYPFPNQKLELGSTGRFVTDLQRELDIAVTGVFDFLTMCKVVLHKFENGLNHNEPTVNEETWNSIFKNNEVQEGDNNAENTRDDATPDPRATAAPGDREGVATVGSVPRTADAADNQTTGDDEAGNPRATTTGVTDATDNNIARAAQPDTNPDAPRQDQPTVTADEQQATGGPAGGYSSAPTETASNEPSPAAADAGAESADDNGPGTATP
jgi:hypothetical protein